MPEDNFLENAILYADESRGVYIPKHFADSINLDVCRLSGFAPVSIDECLEICKAGPNNEWYWDAWDDLQNWLVITNKETGKSWRLYQDGDLWVVPVE